VLGIWGLLEVERALPTDQGILAEVEAFHHDDRKLLVCHPTPGLIYALRHYPVKWSFIPANGRTWELMLMRYEVGTVIPYESHEALQGEALEAYLARARE